MRLKRAQTLISASRLGLLAVVGLLSACSGLSYYTHLAEGQYALLAKRKPIAALLANPKTDAALRPRLQLALDARAYASEVLKLPRNGSYTQYADLGRPFVLKNVFATPEFSLNAVEHCFPIAGCVAYRGYYDAALAEAEAARLKAAGNDVYIGDVPAYSTLGWFDDPVLNTMLRWSDDELVGTIFHELGHQRLYVKNDTSFNESFATFVEQEGLRQWHAARGLPAGDSLRTQRADQFTALVLAARTRLKALYALDLPPATMRERKQQEIEQLRADYRQLRDGTWAGYSGYDNWMNAAINNAKLLPFGLYHQWLPAFAALYAQSGRDWTMFYAGAKRLAERAPAARTAALEQLQAGATPEAAAP